MHFSIEDFICRIEFKMIGNFGELGMFITPSAQ